MTEVAQATVTIIPNMKGSQATISKELGASMDPAGESAGSSLGKSILGTVKKLAIGAAVAKTIGDAMSEGAKLEQSLGGIETLFKDNADVVKGYASEAYKTAGLSANEYMENVTSFSAALIKSMDGDTAAAADLANQAMIDMSDNANKMGTDMSAIQNAYQGFAKGNYTMLDNLKLGYGGTKTEMERLLADASELSGVEYNIDNLDDVYEAIHVIQEDLDITGTTAKEASSTFSGSFASMKAAATNLLGNLALGENIWPSLRSLESTFQTFFVENLLPMVGNIVQMIPGLLAEIPSFIAELIPNIIPVVGDMVSGLASALIDSIPVFVSSIGQLFQSVWDGLTSIDWSAAGQLIVDLLTAAWDGLTLAAQGIWDFVVGIFTGEVEFPDLASFAYTAWNGLITLASTIWTAVKGWFTTTFTWPNISAAAGVVWNALIDVAAGIWEGIKEAFTKTFQFPSLSQAATTVWEGLKLVASGIWEGIKTALTALFDFPSLSQAAYTAWNGLITLASTIWESFKNWFTTTFEFPSLSDLAEAAWSGLTGIAETIWGGVKGTFTGTLEVAGITEEQASQAWNTLTSAATSIWDGVKNIFGSFEIEWPDFGELAKGAFEGLKTAAQNAWNWVKGLFSGGEEEDAVKSVQGSTDEMVSALANANLQINDVDLSSIITANEFVKNTVLGWQRIFENMKLILPTVGVNTLIATHQVISTWVTTYKRKMDFSWSLPTLHGHLPVISVSMQTASSSDGKTNISYPVFNVGTKWFAQGGIFNEPQIIGIGDSRGPEAAVPLDEMWKRMGQEFDNHLGRGAVINNYITVDGAQNPEEYATVLARQLKQQLRMA